MAELKFDSNITPLEYEKLRLTYFKKIQSQVQNQQNNENQEQESPGTLLIQQCPNCNGKLKTKEIKLKDGEILCNYCYNREICMIYSEIDSVISSVDILNLEFHCPHFSPN